MGSEQLGRHSPSRSFGIDYVVSVFDNHRRSGFDAPRLGDRLHCRLRGEPHRLDCERPDDETAVLATEFTGYLPADFLLGDEDADHLGWCPFRPGMYSSEPPSLC
jgi:hypothetical protein